MAALRIFLLSFCVGFFCLSQSVGQGAEQSSGGFVDAPGKELLMSKCFQCHGEKMWKDLKQDRRRWEGVLYRMVGRGALWTEEEINTMAVYLATSFGPQSGQAAK